MSVTNVCTILILFKFQEVNNLYEMFHTRDGLHRRAYQHKTSNVVELMLVNPLCLYNFISLIISLFLLGLLKHSWKPMIIFSFLEKMGNFSSFKFIRAHVFLLSRQVKMSEAIYDMTAYSRLTDAVIHQIMMSSDSKLKKVQTVPLHIATLILLSYHSLNS